MQSLEENIGVSLWQQKKNRQMRLQQNLKLLGFKGRHQESERTAHRMGENTCKSYIR